MRRLRLPLLLVVFCVIGGLPASPVAAAPPPSAYVAMGDSVTQVGSTSGLEYPERFFSFLNGIGAADTLHNVGQVGATSASILGGQTTEALQLIKDPGTRTDVVTVDIGGNDLLGSPSCEGPSPSFSLAGCQPVLSAFAGNLRSLLSQLGSALAQDPGPHEIIVMTYYNPWSGRPGQEVSAANADQVLLGSDLKIDCAGHGTALGLNDLIACIGASYGARVADVYPSFVGKGAQWFADEIHPNDAGHAAIAAVFAQVFGQQSTIATTTTGVRCVPRSVRERRATTCTATVSDASGAGTSPPTGVVSFASRGAGRFTASTCTLGSHGSTAICSVSYTPSRTGPRPQIVTARYHGDATHSGSSGNTGVAVIGSRPQSKRQCRNGGWRDYRQFRDRAECLSDVEHRAVVTCLKEQARIGRVAFQDVYGEGPRHRHAFSRCVRRHGG